MKFSDFFRPEPGQALIETALLLPLILFIIWGVIQLGFIYSTSFVVKYAAYAGVRAGMVDGRNARTSAENTVRQVVGGTVDKLALVPGAGRMRLSVKVLNTGKDIEVQTGYRMPLRFPLAGKVFADGPFSISPLDGHFYRTLSARYRLRMETGGRSQGAE